MNRFTYGFFMALIGAICIVVCGGVLMCTGRWWLGILALAGSVFMVLANNFFMEDNTEEEVDDISR